MKKYSKSVRLGLIFIALLLCVSAVFTFTYAGFWGSAKSVGRLEFVITDVEGSARANYYLNSNEPIPFCLESDDNVSVIEFTPQTKRNEIGALTTGDNEIKLKAESPYVVFEYIFTNTSQLSHGNYYATLTYNVVGTNLNVYAISNQTGGITDPYTNITLNTPTNDSTLFNNILVPISGEVHLYVVIKIDKLYLNSTFENVDFTWKLQNQAFIN